MLDMPPSSELVDTFDCTSMGSSIEAVGVVAIDDDVKHDEQNVAVAVAGNPLIDGGISKLRVERSSPRSAVSSVGEPRGILSSNPTFAFPLRRRALPPSMINVTRPKIDLPMGRKVATRRWSSVTNARCIVALLRSVTMDVPSTTAEPVMKRSPGSANPGIPMKVAVAVVCVRVVTLSAGAGVGDGVGWGAGAALVGDCDVGTPVVGGVVGGNVTGAAVCPVSQANAPVVARRQTPGIPSKKQAVFRGTSDT